MDVLCALAVPLIAVGIWVLMNLAGKGNDPARPFGAGPGQVPRQRPASSEIERFLEEVNRRRQAQLQGQQPRRVEEARPAEPAYTVKPIDEDVPPPPPKPRPAPVVVQAARPRPPVQQAPTRRAVPVTVEPVVEVLPANPPPTARAFPTAPPAVPTTPQTAGQAPRPRLQSPAVRELRRMLRSPNGLRAALLINEVLGQPRCRRPL